MKKILTAGIVLLFSFLNAQQKTAILYGKITNKKGNPISSVSIYVNGHTDTSFSTDSAGNYKITVPADTLVTIVFSSVVMPPVTEKVKLSANEVVKSDFSFDDFTTLTEVEIVDKGDRTVFIQKLPIKDITVQTGASMDFNIILFSQPGVFSNNELSSGYSVRGGNFDENLVYVNDVEIYRPFLTRSGQQEGLSFVNPDMVQEILFSTGGFEAKYGDKMSSVLDITYRKPRKFSGTVSGSLLGGSVHLEGANDSRRLRVLFGARQKSNRYILNSLDTKGDYFPSFTDVQTYVTYDITDEWELGVLGNYSQNNYNLIPQSRQSDFGTVNAAYRLSVYFDGQEYDAFKTYLGALTLSKSPYGKNSNYKVIASVFKTKEQETFDILGEYSLDELETDFGKDNFGQVKFNIGTGSFLNHARNYLDANVFSLEHKGKKFMKYDSLQTWKKEFHWGVKGQQEIIEDQLSEWNMIDSAGYSLPQGDPSSIELQNVIKNSNRMNSTRVSSYFQSGFSKTTMDSLELRFVVGVRALYWTFSEQFLAGPRATFSMKPNWKKDFLFKFSGGYYYQPPFYKELRDIYGNIQPNVKAQTSIHFVAGSDLNFKAWGRDFKFISELYYKHLENLIPYEIDNVRIRYYANNNASGYATGIDFKVNGEFVKGIESWASMSVMTIKENINDDYYVLHYNKSGEIIIPGYTSDDTIANTVTKFPGNIPRPTDQRVNFALFFQDYIPKLERCKMHLNLLFGSGLPFGPPGYDRYKDTLRMPPYRRVDVGFSYELMDEKGKMKQKKAMKYFKSVWLSLEVYNLLAVNNTISYLWVTDVTNRQYAIPNYLSNRLLNLRLITKF